MRTLVFATTTAAGSSIAMRATCSVSVRWCSAMRMRAAGARALALRVRLPSMVRAVEKLRSLNERLATYQKAGSLEYRR
jgi:hypothetical protein